MNTLAPIVMIVFNRPDHTRRVIEALANNLLASESLLYIFSDASRGSQDESAVGQVRTIIHQVVGFKQVIPVERSHNYGCSKNVLSGVSEVLEKHDRCIIVEDDVMAYPLFLQYMNKALDVYQDDSSVFSIGAYSHPFRIPAHYTEETFLLNRSCSWGWGTWKNAWQQLDLDPEVLHMGMKDTKIRKAFSKNGEDLLRTYKNSPEIWDLRICFQQWKLSLNTVFPVQSMVKNIGRDGSGVHYHGGTLNSTDSDNAPSALPQLTHLVTVDEAIRKAFIKQLHKPLWRVISTNIARSIGIYDVLLKRANKR